jgi:hypothetical protein
MKLIKRKTHFRVTALIASMAMSGLSFTTSATPLTNGDFSTNDFTGWQGQTTTSPATIDPLPGSYSLNFDANSGAAVLSTSYDTDGTEYTTYLFQTFDLSSSALNLSFDYLWNANDPADSWLAQLVDSSNSSHYANLTINSSSGQFDLSGFAGLTVQLLFGLENWGGNDDTLTIDNIIIAENQPNGSVPEPGTLLLMGAGMFAARRKFF